jgi:hypothetical protein
MSVRRPPLPVATIPGGSEPLRPIAYVGKVANVEIWQVEHLFIRPAPEWAQSMKHFNHVKDATMFAAFDRRKKLFVGTLDMRLVTIGRPCMKDLMKLDVRYDVAYQIAGSALLPAYFNKGIGIAMYVAAAAYAMKAGGYGIAADACFDSDTSEAAKRVWASKRFREHVRVSGLTAVYLERHDRRSDRPRAQ